MISLCQDLLCVEPLITQAKTNGMVFRDGPNYLEENELPSTLLHVELCAEQTSPAVGDTSTSTLQRIWSFDRCDDQFGPADVFDRGDLHVSRDTDSGAMKMRVNPSN